MPNHISGPSSSKTAPAPDYARRNRTPYPDTDVKVIAIHSSPFTSPQPAAPSHHATRNHHLLSGRERGRQFFACHIGLTHKQFFTAVQFQFKTSCRALILHRTDRAIGLQFTGVLRRICSGRRAKLPVMPQSFSAISPSKTLDVPTNPATNGVRGRI